MRDRILLANDEPQRGKCELESKDQIVIALDFGTTFSGIAYAFKKDEKPEVVPITDWPGLEGFKQPKVPTVISYDLEDPNIFSWGGQKNKSDVIQGIKLLLDPDQPRPLYLPDLTAKAELKRLGKPAVDIAADYIGAMYKHAMGVIGSKVPAQYLDMCQKQFVLSVPAVWSDKAKETTLQAAKKAGISPVTLIKEPEAAAMYTLHTLQNKELQIGDAFVICDAGGGTVDLISYEITQLHPRLEVKELVPGKGEMAGSLGLNKRFEQAVKSLMGEDQYFALRKTKGFEQATQQFDRTVKTAFRGDPEEDYYINFPMAELADDLENRLVSNCWNMTGDDVKTIFDPLIADIARLVEEQVNLVKMKRMSKGDSQALVKAIFLVGGFGSSEYLKNCLEAEHPDIQVIQPHGAWAAIMKGAVLSRLPQEAFIVSNQATRHYGVKACCTYDDVRDQGQVKTWDSKRGEYKCDKMQVMFQSQISDGTKSYQSNHRSNQWTWYINRGEDLVREHTIRFSFYRSLAEGYSDDQLIFRDELIQSESKHAPVHPSRTAMKTNCTLIADLRTADRKKFLKTVGVDGMTYYEVHYQLAITIQSAVMKFSLSMDGKEMGTVNAKYD